MHFGLSYKEAALLKILSLSWSKRSKDNKSLSVLIVNTWNLILASEAEITHCWATNSRSAHCCLSELMDLKFKLQSVLISARKNCALLIPNLMVRLCPVKEKPWTWGLSSWKLHLPALLLEQVPQPCSYSVPLLFPPSLNEGGCGSGLSAAHLCCEHIQFIKQFVATFPFCMDPKQP